MAEKPPAEKTGIFSNILAVAGLVILIAIIIWGLSRLASLSKPWLSSFSSVFYPSSKSIKVTVPNNDVLSGEGFFVSWKYTPESTGTYAFLYQCHEGFQFKAAATDAEPALIPCGVGYTMPATDNKFSVVPILAGTSSLNVRISIIFMSSAPVTPGQTVSQPEGSASVTVVGSNTDAASPNTTLATKPEVRESAGSASISQEAKIPAIAPVTGNSDFSVKILSVGIIDPISGDIISRPPASPDDLVAVRFLISNVGSASTGPWYFTARLPTSPDYIYTSPEQISLARGSSIENMLRFKSAVPGDVFSVSVDPANQVNELNEVNNTATINI